MKTIGITGGIGSGKSLVAAQLAEYGAALIDADQKGHAALQIPLVQKRLCEIFGTDIIQEGCVDRHKLAERAFKSDDTIQSLNKIVHPNILTLMARDIQILSKQNYPYIVIDAALLFEVNLDKMCDCSVTIDAPVEMCIKRVQQRSNLTKDQILRRMRFQLSFEEKRKNADYIVSNNNSIKKLLEETIKLHQWILTHC